MTTQNDMLATGYNIVPGLLNRKEVGPIVFWGCSINVGDYAPRICKPNARSSDRADKVIEVIGSVLGATLFFFIRYRKNHPACRGGDMWVRRWR